MTCGVCGGDGVHAGEGGGGSSSTYSLDNYTLFQCPPMEAHKTFLPPARAPAVLRYPIVQSAVAVMTCQERPSINCTKTQRKKKL